MTTENKILTLKSKINGDNIKLSVCFVYGINRNIWEDYNNVLYLKETDRNLLRNFVIKGQGKFFEDVFNVLIFSDLKGFRVKGLKSKELKLNMDGRESVTIRPSMYIYVDGKNKKAYIKNIFTDSIVLMNHYGYFKCNKDRIKYLVEKIEIECF